MPTRSRRPPPLPEQTNQPCLNAKGPFIEERPDSRRFGTSGQFISLKIACDRIAGARKPRRWNQSDRGA
jgi:hypothetical protein